MQVNIPPPKEERPKVPPEPPKKPSIWGEEGYIRTSKLSEILKRPEYYDKLGLGEEARREIAEILRKPFGEYFSRSDWRIESLIRELKDPGSSSDEKIRKTAQEIRQKYGQYKANTIAEELKKIFGL